MPSEIAEDGVNEKAPLEFAVVVPKVEESINRVTLELASALPVIVGVESLIDEEVAKEVGASGAVVSLVLDVDVPLPPDNEDFPANVSIGKINSKPRVDNKTADL